MRAVLADEPGARRLRVRPALRGDRAAGIRQHLSRGDAASPRDAQRPRPEPESLAKSIWGSLSAHPLDLHTGLKPVGSNGCGVIQRPDDGASPRTVAKWDRQGNVPVSHTQCRCSRHCQVMLCSADCSKQGGCAVQLVSQCGVRSRTGTTTRVGATCRRSRRARLGRHLRPPQRLAPLRRPDRRVCCLCGVRSSMICQVCIGG